MAIKKVNNIASFIIILSIIAVIAYFGPSLVGSSVAVRDADSITSSASSELMQITADGFCSGTAKACNTYSSSFECDAQDGCIPGGFGSCSGTATACSLYSAQASCESQDLCTWTLSETTCNDGQDNDGNGKIDCADPACNGKACSVSCPGGSSGDPCTGTCSNSQCSGCTIGSFCREDWANCEDQKDNDQDGKVDHEDTDCMGGQKLSSSIFRLDMNDGFNFDANSFSDEACSDICLEGHDYNAHKSTISLGSGAKLYYGGALPASTSCLDGSISYTASQQTFSNNQWGCVKTSNNRYYYMLVEAMEDGPTTVAIQISWSEKVCTDSDGDGYSSIGGQCGTPVDCDDSNSAISPVGTEDCNGIDDDCNEQIDEELTNTLCPIQTGVCAGTTKNCVNAVWTTCYYGSDYQATESNCKDEQDNDCDGAIDCLDSDCASASNCLSSPTTCSDGIQNQGEAGIDCGGPCPACSGGPTPTCSDGIQNQDETGVDCGGPCSACGGGGGGGGGCTQTNGGVEICDNVDNDCDGVVDNGFNLQTDVSNCGACGIDCANLPHVIQVSCEGGHCIISPLSCAQGYYDIDLESTTGCEYSCTKTNGGVEKVDGLDNNCDGQLLADELDMDEDTFTIATGDCNDNDAGIKPDAIESCIGNIDENCDGNVNEGCSTGNEGGEDNNIFDQTVGSGYYSSGGGGGGGVDSETDIVTSTDPLKTQKTSTTTTKKTTTTTFKTPEVGPVKVTKFPTTAVAIGTIAIVLIAGLAWYFMYFRPGQGPKSTPTDYTQTPRFNEQYPGEGQ